MARKKNVFVLENWKFEDGLLSGSVDGLPIMPGLHVMTNGCPNYIETTHQLYLLGEPAAKPLTGIQAQAVAVVCQALLTDIMGAEAVREAAEGTAKAAIHALIGAGLLVS